MAVARFAVVENGCLAGQRGGHKPVPWWSFSKTVMAAAAVVLVRDGFLTLDQELGSEHWSANSCNIEPD